MRMRIEKRQQKLSLWWADMSKIMAVNLENFRCLKKTLVVFIHSKESKICSHKHLSSFEQ